MPSSITHGYFGIDVYNRLDERVRKKLSNYKGILKAFSQGPDPYFFYDFHLSKRSKKIFDISRSMQHSKTNDYFLSLINYINDKKYYSNPNVLAYLIGHICHFVLDSTVHPFIIYNTGIYNNKDKSTYKYNGLHEEMEYFIDIYLINKREKIDPKKFKIHNFVFDISKFDDELNDTIDTVIKKVYGFDDTSKIYYKSLVDMKKFYFVFNYDRFGIKKEAYKVMDLICNNKTVRKKELSFHVDPNVKIEYLNLEKKTWNHPCDINEKYNLSFEELYDKAILKASHIIKEVLDMFNKKYIDNEKLKKLFGNLDYGTGKDCNISLEYKYFKF